MQITFCTQPICLIRKLPRYADFQAQHILQEYLKSITVIRRQAQRKKGTEQNRYDFTQLPLIFEF